MSNSKQLTHDQSEPKYNFVIISIILTFVALVGIVCFSIIFYSISLSQDQDRKDRDYIYSSFLDFQKVETEELNRLGRENGKIKLPIELAKERVIIEYAR
tara:strand:- start:14 stop:313 length:300 start_codon:yes stop_codon:yes gene_type:complete